MSKKNNYKVYVHINKINGKRYYGITCLKYVKSRWKQGNGYKENKYFTRAINKYGWKEGFEHIVLFDNLTKEEAELLEQMYIALYDTTNPKYGYNIALGGKGSNGVSGELHPMYGKHISEETRRKLSEANIGKKLSEETKRKIGEASRGRKHTEETKKKLSEINKGKNNPTAKSVYIVELDMTFESVVECAEYLGCLPKSVSRVLIGERNTIKGYHVIYIEDKFNKDKINEVMEHECNKKSVYIIELDMTFESVKECAEYLGCSEASVSNILKGRTKACKGYHIIYAKDRDKLAS